jgi:adenylate kinase
MTARKGIKHILLLGAPGVGKGTFSSLIRQETGWSMFSVGEILREEIKKKSDIGQKIESNLQQGQLAPVHMVNELAFSRIDDFHASVISNEAPSKSTYGFALMLDGYPRSVEQAEGFLQRYHPSLLLNLQNTMNNDVIAVDIQLDRRVILDKLMGRRLCKVCKTGYNFADVLYDGYDMPAILPPTSNASDPNVNECCTHPENLIQRDDDNMDTIMKRLNVYEKENQPLVDYFREKNILYTFDVKRGIKDTPQLLQLITEAAHI